MSYCVNCGVKLNQNVSACPLCGVEVINPIDPIDHSAEIKYPHKRDIHESAFERSLWIKIVTIVLAVPVLLSITINTIFGDGLNWSLYVAGSLGLVWVWLISPFIFKQSFMVIWVVIDAVSLLGFLYLIEYLTPSQDWVFPLALPIIAAFTFLFLSLVLLIQRRILQGLQIAAFLFTTLGVFCVILNALINLHTLNIFKLDWSLLIIIPFTAFAIIAALIQKRRWIVEELEHWFRV